ncbi:hypothetical protein [Mesorhizobium sp.]|uniref:hypothetical protein n=1 Tax=Mesorhizobium sp. TaxID=1871066 RepID=UPI000FE6245A|nr:hypothetical protein [Mesorhizobium sp.]RWQ57828.1 MAG: hypothetical protein EOS84_04635 [Mesorhizobium sp.]
MTEDELKGYAKLAVPLSPWVQGQIPALDNFMRVEKLEYPKGLKVNGADYAPFVTYDAFKVQTGDFPAELLKAPANQ